MLRILAPAKVNLGLRILAREVSGFHQLETVFLGLEFGDVLTLALGGEGISLTVENPPPGPIEENLVYRAARVFLDRSGFDTGVEIRLTKRIPVQGGLGGGSSDAAATLKGLSSLLPGRLHEPDLWNIAGELGSDVPFFLSPSPLALAWGRGERLLPLSPLPERPVLVAVPQLAVSTPEAFQALAGERDRNGNPRRPGCLDRARMDQWEGIGAKAENDF
jgi:4-diphosphocytidyl-2-C-methyl-D-erythritol kinase